MFSVLILNKKTTESFNEYYPLFLSSIKSKDVAVCRWHESGSDINAILPDLHELTDDKKVWRAIIVRTEDDIDTYSFSEENPYDYKISYQENIIYDDKIPLLRLIHYLGGIQSPKVEFIPVSVTEKGKAARVVYKTSVDPSEQERYEHLSQVYSFDGHRPTEIILLTLRTIKNDDSQMDALEGTHSIKNELQSSEFWKRNGYSGNCRFVVYDIKNEGKIQRDADLFGFWSIVHLLSINDIDPNYLQAYRLYKAKIDFSISNMKEDIQSTVIQLIGSRNYIEKAIHTGIEKSLKQKNELPHYSVEIPVVIDSPKFDDVSIKSSKFALTPSSIFKDKDNWNSMKEDAFEQLDTCIKNSERAIDESAEKNHSSFEVPDEIITALDKSQKRDIKLELSELYIKIIKMQGSLPKKSENYREILSEKEQRVFKDFRTRINSSKSTGLITAIACFLLLSLVPAFYCYTIDSQGDIKAIVIVYAVIILFLGLIQLFNLLSKKFELDNDISEYNKSLNNELHKLIDNAQLFSKFISAVTTLSRGQSFLKKLSKIKFEQDSDYTMRLNHIKAINEFLTKLQKLSIAYNMDISFEINNDINYEVDYFEKPQLSLIYTFNSGDDKLVAINKSGDYLNSPFDFIDRIILEREELYDEYRN